MISFIANAVGERLWIWRVLTVVLAIAGWQASVSIGLISRKLIADPASVAAWLWEWHTRGEGPSALGLTLFEAAGGYVVGLLLGALVAAIFVRQPFIASVFDPYMALVAGIPLLVIAPFFLIAFGYGPASKVAVSAVLVFFLAFFNLYGGLRSVDRVLIDRVRLMGASLRRMTTDLYIPAVFVWAMSTLRTGVGLALVGAIVGEFVGSVGGVGRTISRASELDQPEVIMGGLLTLAIVAGILDRVFLSVERRYARWSVF